MGIKTRKTFPDPTTQATPVDETESRGRNPFLQGLRLDVYNFILANKDCTRADVTKGLSLRSSSATARIKELIDEGLIYEPRGVRKRNGSGVAARALRVSPEGASAAVRDHVQIKVDLFVDTAGYYYAECEVVNGPVLQALEKTKVESKTITVMVDRQEAFAARPMGEKVTPLAHAPANDSKSLIIDGSFRKIG